MTGAAPDRAWLVAGIASVGVHGALVLAAIALYRTAVVPVDPPPLSVEVIVVDPAPAAPAPAARPPPPARPAPGAPVRPAQAVPAAHSEQPVAATANASPPSGSPVAETIGASLEEQGAPALAAKPDVRVIAAPAPRPRPLRVRAEPSLSEAGRAAGTKPRIDPVPLPLADKARPASRADASAARPFPQTALRPRNGALPDSAARPAAGNPPPAYPRVARRRGLQGRLVLRVQIGPDGAARDVQVVESSGHPVLDASARKAVAAWRFTPARRAGAPVASRIDIPVSFRLRR